MKRRKRRSNGVVALLIGVTAMLVPSCARVGSSFDDGENVIESSDISRIRDTVRLRHIIDSLSAAGPSRELSLAYYQMGLQVRYANDFYGSIEYLKKGLEVAETGRDTLLITRNLNNIAIAYRKMSVLDEASYYYYQSLKYINEYSDKIGRDIIGSRSAVFNGLGNILLELSNYDAAEQNFRTALECAQLLDDQTGQAMNLSDIGYIFKSRGQLDSAQLYFRRSLDVNLRANNSKGVAINHMAFGELYEDRGLFDKSLTEYQLALDQLSDLGDEWNLISVYIAGARIFMEMGYYSQSREALDMVHTLVDGLDSYSLHHQMWDLEYRLNEHLGNKHAAFESLKNSMAYRDSMLNETSRSNIVNDRVQYVIDTRNSELAIIQQNYNLEHKSRTYILVVFLLIILLSFGAIAFMSWVLRIRMEKHNLLQKLEHDRTTFFTSVTHEFRTPLTVILGLATELSNDAAQDPDQVRSMSKAILRQGRGLLKLVNQLLDINKVNSSIGKTEWRHGDVVSFMRTVVEPYIMHARQNGIEMVYFPGEERLEIDFVPDFLQKIVINLIGNALKYTPEGGHIYISTVQVGNTIVLKVSDTGAGMTQETVKRVFEPFYVGGDRGSDMSTGVGMALAQQLIQAMGGTVEVRSELGRGSTFTVCLPATHSSSTPIPPLNEVSDEPDLTSGDVTAALEALPQGGQGTMTEALVMIVEDNRDVAFYIGSLLEREYRLCYSVNGLEGLEMAREHVPDLIVTDLMMPEMDGLEFVRELRSTDVLSHVPIIVVTAKTDDDERLRLLEAGADAYMAKPLDASEFKIRVQSLLKQRTILRDKFSQSFAAGGAQSVQEETPEISKLDKAFLAKFVDYVLASLSQDKPADIGSIASHMCVSPRQLSRKINALTGESTSAYVNRIKLNKAKQMLDADTSTPIADIAMSCGFEDMSYFGKIFRQYEGVSPSQYRKRVK